MRETSPTRSGQALDDSTIRVWRVLLDGRFPSETDLRECLSAEERSRAERIRGVVERRRFVAARIALRHILARYQGGSAAALPLARESGGRPFVAGGSSYAFSLTHSADLALIAVAGQAVGVDVERVRPVGYMRRIARRVLHDDTVRALAALPAERRRIAFLDAWTQREAHVKALGGGIFRTPDDLPFSVAQPDDSTVHVVYSRSDRQLWSVARFAPDPLARATVVVRGTARNIHLEDWEGLA
jgi:4'-phosphopantetheinyl transferase